jgi:hypothetical protein
VTLWVYDGASAFDLDVAKANGGAACTGYIVGSPGGFAHIDRARVDQIRAKGMGFSPNWERAADAFLTYSVGECGQAGVEALNACNALGVPAGVRVSFSIDTQVPAGRFPEMAQKLDAAQAGMGGRHPAFLYGQSDLIDWLGANPGSTKLRGKHWLMMSTWNQPYNIRSPFVCMVQEHNLDGSWHSSPVPGTDSNLLIDPYALGAWWPDNSPYGGDMPLSADDVKAIWAYAVAHVDAAGKADTSPHPMSYWLTDAQQQAAQAASVKPLTAQQITDAVKAAGVTLTDAQVQTIVAKLTTAQPTPPKFTVTLTGDATPKP